MKTVLSSLLLSLILLASGTVLGAGNQSQIDVKSLNQKLLDKEKTDTSKERAVSISYRFRNMSGLELENQNSLSDKNMIAIGFEQALTYQYSVHAEMGFGFSDNGDQEYFQGMVIGTYQRPMSSDKWMAQFGAGLAFSQFQLGDLSTNKNQVSWLEGIIRFGAEYRISTALTLSTQVDFMQAGLGQVESDQVKGSALSIQPIGLIYRY